MVKVGGQWVSPAEIEALLGEHPAVLEAAAAARPDAVGLTSLCAFAVLRGDAVATPEELRAWLRARVAGYKVPRRVEIVGELPKTATGKIQRFRLRGGA
jgi:benzoate-CoA ligase